MTIQGWDDARISALTARWSEGWSATQIAAELGATRNAILGKINRLGLSNRKVVSGKAKVKREQRRRNGRAQRMISESNQNNPRPAMVPEEPVKELPVLEIVASSLRIPFRDLEAFSKFDSNQCRYIASEVPEPDYLACGNPTPPGQSYCSSCKRILSRVAMVITDEDRFRRRMHYLKMNQSARQAKPIAPDEAAA